MFYSFKQSNGVRAMSTSVGHPLSPAAPMADAVPFRGGAARTPRRHHGRMPAQAAAPREPAPFVSDAEERAYERRDLRGVAWAFLYEIRHSPEYIKLAAPAASMMRVILALGEEPEDRALAIAEAAVVGSVLHGIAPPRRGRLGDRGAGVRGGDAGGPAPLAAAAWLVRPFARRILRLRLPLAGSDGTGRSRCGRRRC